MPTPAEALQLFGNQSVKFFFTELINARPSHQNNVQLRPLGILSTEDFACNAFDTIAIYSTAAILVKDRTEIPGCQQTMGTRMSV